MRAELPPRIARRLLPALVAMIAALVGGAVLRADGGAGSLALALDSDEGVWNQPLGFAITGVGCQPHLGTPAEKAPGTIEVPIEDACGSPRLDHSFSLRGTLVGFEPGAYTVRVSGGANEPTASLHLYFPAHLELELPAVASSDDVAPVTISYMGGCNGFDSHLDPGVLRIYSEGCPFEPPPPHPVRSAPPVGPLAPGDYSVRLYAYEEDLALSIGRLHVRDAHRCMPADDHLCLRDGRFALSGHWRAFDGSTGPAHATQLDGNEESGLLWFFSPANAEVTVKVLDGCGVNGAWWAFLSSASTVEYEVTVADTVTGASRVYRNELGHKPGLVADTAMEVCP